MSQSDNKAMLEFGLRIAERLQQLDDRVAEIEARMTSTGSLQADGMPHSHSSNPDDRLISLIDKKTKLVAKFDSLVVELGYFDEKMTEYIKMLPKTGEQKALMLRYIYRKNTVSCIKELSTSSDQTERTAYRRLSGGIKHLNVTDVNDRKRWLKNW